MLTDTVALVRQAGLGADAVEFRAHTNGLWPTHVAAELAAAGVDKCTVALASAGERQYAELMQPSNGRGLKDTVAFVEALVRAGVAVDMTTVMRPEVDLAAAEAFAKALGASWRGRSWHP